MKYITVVLTIIFVTYGQLIIKSGIDKLGPAPAHNFGELFKYFFHAITNISILSGLLAAILAAFSWMAAMSKFELSSIYPLLSLNFVIVPLFSIILFGESINIYKIAGIILILTGIFIFSRGIN